MRAWPLRHSKTNSSILNDPYGRFTLKIAFSFVENYINGMIAYLSEKGLSFHFLSFTRISTIVRGVSHAS